MAKKLTHEQRRAQILEAALKIATDDGFSALTRSRVAKACGVTMMTVSLRFGSMAALRAEVLKEAKLRGLTAITDAALTIHGGYPARVKT